MSDKRIQYLVVDTSAFIKNAQLQDIGTNIITTQEVVDEIKNKRQLRRLVVLPYDLAVKQSYSENVKIVTEFAKKTGDYLSLSATDIQVIALTYQLEKEHVGTAHLKSEPTIPRTVNVSKTTTKDEVSTDIAGFYMPSKDEQSDDSSIHSEETSSNEDESLDKDENIKIIHEDKISEAENHIEINFEPKHPIQDNQTEQLAEKFANLEFVDDDLKCFGAENVNEVLISITDVQDIESEDDCENEEESEDSDDDVGWITPGNVAEVKRTMGADLLEENPAVVACMTTDFAMQNVLKQMGLSVAALDGRVIRQIRTFILRCYTCFKTTSVMTKLFCPSCGHKTLKRVAVSLDEDGKQQVHINLRKPLTARGKKFSLPTPQGGKHANNPVLFEDQPIPQQRATRLARLQNDPLDPDYIAGYSPFIVRDVNSKSAMLGIRNDGGNVKHWMKRNPNQARRNQK